MDSETISVLLVEDSTTQAAIIRRMLQSYREANYEVDWLESTDGALDRINEGSFDLVLLDYNLPGEDGLSFLRRVGGNGDLPPIIMLTAGGNERLAAEAMQAGASDYYPKSAINAEILGYSIHKALERFRLSDLLGGAEQVIFTLAAAVEAKDPLTDGHLERMAYYSVRLGQALGLSEHDLEILRFGGMLHDIGKLAVSETILTKIGPLDADDWIEMRKHPAIGEAICATLRHAHEVNPVIRHHHERWDGEGYPDRLQRDAIPIHARIVCAADAYDAMSSDRPYRNALRPAQIVAELSNGSGSQFDPDVVRALVGLIEQNQIECPETALVQAST